MNVIWTDTATFHALEITEYIAIDSPSNALAWLDSIYEKAESLVEYPYKYPEAEGAYSIHIRDCTFGNFRIIYKVDPDLIYIMALKRCAQEKDDEEVRE